MKIIILIIMLFWYLVLSFHNVILLHRIRKALKFIDGMFDDGDGDKIIDNLLKLEEILKGEENENNTNEI